MKGAHRKLRILLVDEEGILRDGLCALLNSEETLAVARVAGGTAALRNLTSPPTVDLIIVDFAASSVDPPETMELARERWPGAPILVFTLDACEKAMQTALRLGVDGYLLKSDKRSDLLNAVHSVLARKRYISSALLGTVVKGFVDAQLRTKGPDSDGLSEREREVMRLICVGLRTREIAAKLFISHKTADKHRTNLMRKLGLKTGASVAAYAILNGYYKP